MHTLVAGQFIVFASLLAQGFECPRFIRGDSNQDGKVDLTDAIRTLDFLFQDGQVDCHDAADANDGGSIDITDPIFTLLFLFSAGDPPPAPGPIECGRDETADRLECLAGAGCEPAAVPMDFSDFARFEYLQEPALGFCPQLGKVFKATIQREGAGYRLEMSTLEERAQGQGECIEVISDVCAVEVPLPPRTLIEEEAAAVKSAFSAVPVFQEINPICFCIAIDPCVVHNLIWDGFLASGFECHAPRAPGDTLGTILLLLEELRP